MNQGGKREGAVAAYLEIWHADVVEVLDMKEKDDFESHITDYPCAATLFRDD